MERTGEAKDFVKGVGEVSRDEWEKLMYKLLERALEKREKLEPIQEFRRSPVLYTSNENTDYARSQDRLNALIKEWREKDGGENRISQAVWWASGIIPG
jgi:hypothetical protein